jgi:iron complex transport system ATP-binding protein
VPELSVEHLHYRLAEHDILQDISLQVTSGELVAIVGPNGAGKSTLLHMMARLLPPTLGTVRLDGQPLRSFSRKAVARQIALLPQQARLDFGFMVHDVVRMGRHPHLGRFQLPTIRDEEVVQQAMDLTETWPFASRLITEVSGGERQLILLAQALAQEPRFLLLDEPTANLDIAHQCQVIRLLQQLADKGTGVVVVIHDLSVAVRSFRRLILVHEGSLVADGQPTEVLSVETINRIFRVQARFYRDEASATPILWFPV